MRSRRGGKTVKSYLCAVPTNGRGFFGWKMERKLVLQVGRGRRLEYGANYAN